MRRLSWSVGVAALVIGLIAPSTAHAQQSVNFFIGGFAPLRADDRGEGRFSDEVLARNLDFLSFRIHDFDGATVGGEYLVGIGDFLDVGLGAGYYSQTARSSYFDLEDENGRSIEQRLRLRIAPYTATVRFLPLGHRDAIKPYVGAGVGFFSWRYSESGDFVRPDLTIYRGTFVGSGTAVGPVIFGGLQFPIADGVAVGGEARYQHASGDLPNDQGFSASTIDLGGWSGVFTFSVHF
jgi:opacity protein-like surface antigen